MCSERTCVGCGHAVGRGGFIHSSSKGGYYVCLERCAGLRFVTPGTCSICKAEPGRPCTDLNTRNELTFPHRSRPGAVERAA